MNIKTDDNKEVVFKNGYSHTLEQLFSGNRKIIIPDLQRDYTWGDKIHSNDNKRAVLVSDFCDNLVNLFNSSPNQLIPFGMIYAYQSPENHYHLIDGQQRITTLFLLMGMLYKYTKLPKLRERLVSDFELNHDDQEPYLQYSIRESTLYFLSDLVVKFFLIDQNNAKEVKIIKSEPWYFSEYNHDPSIQSMLGALEVIEKLINENKTLDFEDFSEWLINKITFFYFDMENREHGEEMFVVINTTGEPLTITEDLKPLLLGDISCKETREKLSKEWEERETFFWEQRKSGEYTADEGVKDFLTWYVRIKNKTESIDLTKYFKESSKKNELKELHSFFISFQETLELIDKERDLKRLFTEDNKGNYTFTLSCVRGLSTRLNNIFLPFWYFTQKFCDAKLSIKEKFLRKLRKNHFHSEKEFLHRKESYVDWRYVLQIIEKSTNPDDALKFSSTHLESTPNIKIATWYTVEEQIIENLRNRIPEIAKTLDEWEDHPDLMGDLSILLQAYLLEEGDSNIPEVVDAEYDFFELSRIMENYKSVIDPLRTRKVENNALFNIFRLFRIFSGIKQIGHIRNTNWWDIRGVIFSDSNKDHLRLEKNDFLHVIKATQPFEFCIKYVVQHIKKEDFMPNSFFHPEARWFIPEKFIKIWLTLKVFAAIKDGNLLLESDDHGTGIAAYTDKLKNQIINDQNHTDFTLENSLCGFAKVRSKAGVGYIEYTQEKENWCKSYSIYTPFAEVPFIGGTRNRQAANGDIALLAANKKSIDEVIEFIFR